MTEVRLREILKEHDYTEEEIQSIYDTRPLDFDEIPEDKFTEVAELLGILKKL